VQQVPLAPAGGPSGHLLVHAAAEHLDVRVLVETVRIGAPARFPFALLIDDERQDTNGRGGDRGSERLGRRLFDGSIPVDWKGFLEDDVVAYPVREW
jgi:hypothetical protein